MKNWNTTDSPDVEPLTGTALLLYRQFGTLTLGVPELCKVLRFTSKGSLYNAMSKGRLPGLRTYRLGHRRVADTCASTRPAPARPAPSPGRRTT